MADPRIQATTLAPSRNAGDGGLLNWRGTRDGAGFVADWRQAAIMEGRGFTIIVGAFSTPVAGGGTAAIIDQDRPRFAVSVPDGTCILPIRTMVQCQTPLLATDADESEILLACDPGVAAAAGTSTAETIYNLRTDSPRASLCTAASVHTADLGVVPTLTYEYARAVKVGDMNGTPANALWGDLSLLYEPLNPPIIFGPATYLGYWGGTVATAGFAQVCWIEFPESMFA